MKFDDESLLLVSGLACVAHAAHLFAAPKHVHELCMCCHAPGAGSLRKDALQLQLADQPARGGTAGGGGGGGPDRAATSDQAMAFHLVNCPPVCLYTSCRTQCAALLPGAGRA